MRERDKFFDLDLLVVFSSSSLFFFFFVDPPFRSCLQVDRSSSSPPFASILVSFLQVRELKEVIVSSRVRIGVREREREGEGKENKSFLRKTLPSSSSCRRERASK